MPSAAAVAGVVPFLWSLSVVLTVSIIVISMTVAAPQQAHGYSIGTPLKPWGAVERAEWLRTRTFQRSYPDEVLTKLEKGFEGFDVHQYGTLEVDGLEGLEDEGGNTKTKKEASDVGCSWKVISVILGLTSVALLVTTIIVVKRNCFLSR